MGIKKKIWPEYFELVKEGTKRFELRVADFDVKEGDVLILEEWDPKEKKYTGRKQKVLKLQDYVEVIPCSEYFKNRIKNWDKLKQEEINKMKEQEKIEKDFKNRFSGNMKND